MDNHSGKGRESPAQLVAAIIAAKRSGDRELVHSLRRKLEQQYGVKLSFAREMLEESKGDDHE